MLPLSRKETYTYDDAEFRELAGTAKRLDGDGCRAMMDEGCTGTVLIAAPEWVQ